MMQHLDMAGVNRGRAETERRRRTRGRSTMSTPTASMDARVNLREWQVLCEGVEVLRS